MYVDLVEVNAGTLQCVSKQPVQLPSPPSCHSTPEGVPATPCGFSVPLRFLFASGYSAQGLSTLQMLC